MTAEPERHGWNDRLRELFIAFDQDEGEQVPMYGRICRAAADDPAVLELLDTAPKGQRRPILLLAALHDLVLEHPDVPAGRWFPSVTGEPVPPGDPWPDVRATLLDHVDRIRRVVATRSTQTNEVNRSALWATAVPWAAADVDAPVALLELGASAGLNLGFDRYLVDYGDGDTAGPADSEVRLSCAVRSGQRPARRMPEVVGRLGVDLEPVDLSDPVRQRWLRACLWPEQTERVTRFDAAVTATLVDPPTIVAGDAVDELPDAVERLPHDAHVVVYWSWFLTYLARDRRRALDAALDVIGHRRPLTLLSAEASGVHEAFVDPGLPGDDPAEFRSVVGASRWRGGRREDRVVARCHAHLRWLDWLG